MLPSDRAGDTSRGSGNAPAHFISPPDVLSAEELIRRLSDKGVRLDDEGLANYMVDAMGYRHVVRYVPPLLRFAPNPSISSLFAAISSDLHLQCVLQRYVLLLERSLKTRLSNALAREFGAFPHLNPELFKRRSDCDSFRQASRGELVRKARGGSRYAAKLASEGLDLPIWSACEFSSFGSISKLFSNLAPCSAKAELASHFGFSVSVLESWFEALVFLRNECSHGGVLYGRVLERQPKQVRELSRFDNRYCFYQVALLAFLLERERIGLAEGLCADVEAVFTEENPSTPFGGPAMWRVFIDEIVT